MTSGGGGGLENPGQGSEHALEPGKQDSKGDCGSGGTWAGQLTQWMPWLTYCPVPQSLFLSTGHQDSLSFLVTILDPELTSSCPLQLPLQGPHPQP